MKRIIGAALMIIAAVIACIGCNNGKPDYAFSLGNAKEFDHEASLSQLHDELLRDKGVYHLVCRTGHSEGSSVTMTPVELYEYPTFIKPSGSDSEPVLFRGRYKLYIELITGETDPNSMQAVCDQAVFGALEKLVFPLAQKTINSVDILPSSKVWFKLVEDDRETDYCICRDGSVLLDDKVLAAKLSPVETAYFFAVAKAYQLTRIKEFMLAEADAMPVVTVEKDGKTITLPNETALRLFKLLSDDAGRHGSGPFMIRCCARVAFDHVTSPSLLGITCTTEAGGRASEETYYVLEDGRLVKTFGWSSIYNYDAGDQLCDYLYFTTELISETAYPIDEIVHLVESCGAE